MRLAQGTESAYLQRLRLDDIKEGGTSEWAELFDHYAASLTLTNTLRGRSFLDVWISKKIKENTMMQRQFARKVICIIYIHNLLRKLTTQFNLKPQLSLEALVTFFPYVAYNFILVSASQRLF